MELDQLLLIGHLVGVFLMIAAAGITTAAALKVGRLASPAAVLPWLDLQRTSELFLTTPGAVITFIFGSALVGREYDFSQPWVSASYLLLIVLLGVDHGWFLRFVRGFRAEVAALAATGATDLGDLRAKWTAPLPTAIGIGMDASFLVFLILMVTRPGS